MNRRVFRQIHPNFLIVLSPWLDWAWYDAITFAQFTANRFAKGLRCAAIMDVAGWFVAVGVGLDFVERPRTEGFD